MTCVVLRNRSRVRQFKSELHVWDYLYCSRVCLPSGTSSAPKASQSLMSILPQCTNIQYLAVCMQYATQYPIPHSCLRCILRLLFFQRCHLVANLIQCIVDASHTPAHTHTRTHTHKSDTAIHAMAHATSSTQQHAHTLTCRVSALLPAQPPDTQPLSPPPLAHPPESTGRAGGDGRSTRGRAMRGGLRGLRGQRCLSLGARQPAISAGMQGGHTILIRHMYCTNRDKCTSLPAVNTSDVLYARHHRCLHTWLEQTWLE